MGRIHLRFNPKMSKFTLFLAFILIGASAKHLSRNAEEWTEDDIRNVLHMVFCACDEGDMDGSITLDELTSPVCSAIHLHMFDYEVNEDDFNACDLNGDGKLEVDEVMEAIMNEASSMRSWQLRDFSENTHVEAAVRVLGCSCDYDGSMSLSWEEISDDMCQAVQAWIFDGHTMCEEGFSMVDFNGNGEIEGEEAAAALEWAMENYA